MDDSIFADEPEPSRTSRQSEDFWHILLVDDEAGVHQVTEMVLRDFHFDGRALKVSNAYSAKEALALMAQHDDFALAIVDVVMETDEAGLELVRHIRSVQHNHYTRLVLRTGQPGQAPEEEIILAYDIDDYKDKTELTSNKLLTLLYSALRSYRDICVLDQHRRSLEQVVLASTEIFEAHNLSIFASAVLRQICNLLHINGALFYCTSLNQDLEASQDFRVLAASGDMSEYTTKQRSELPQTVNHAFDHALRDKQPFSQEGAYTGYFSTRHGGENLLYVSLEHELSDIDMQLLDIYASNVALTYENLLLKEEILASQKELAYILGEAVEQRSKETGSHVKRVAHFSYLLALEYGLDQAQADLIKLASPLHDVGKIAIPDHILKKPGKLTPDEWEVMQSHAQLGADLLKSDDNEVLKMGAIIAAQHHEHWQGGGYPKGLKGEEIHIAGRITALADVFDALGCQRCYKKSWPMTDIIEEIDAKKGKQFDPRLVEVLHKNLDAMFAIRDAFPE